MLLRHRGRALAVLDVASAWAPDKVPAARSHINAGVSPLDDAAFAAIASFGSLVWPNSIANIPSFTCSTAAALAVTTVLGAQIYSPDYVLAIVMLEAENGELLASDCTRGCIAKVLLPSVC